MNVVALRCDMPVGKWESLFRGGFVEGVKKDGMHDKHPHYRVLLELSSPNRYYIYIT